MLFQIMSGAYNLFFEDAAGRQWNPGPVAGCWRYGMGKVQPGQLRGSDLRERPGPDSAIPHEFHKTLNTGEGVEILQLSGPASKAAPEFPEACPAARSSCTLFRVEVDKNG